MRHTKYRWLSYSKHIALDILLYNFTHQRLDEAWKWFDVVLKEFVEPVRGNLRGMNLIGEKSQCL